MGEAVNFDTGVTVEVVGLTATRVEAQTPGEVSGPAVLVEVRVTNSSSQDINLDSAVVMLSTIEGEVGVGTTAGTNVPLAGDLRPGASLDSSYVFMLGSAADSTVTVSVNYAAGQPVAEFTGKLSS